RRGDVVLVVRVPGEVELCGEQLVTGGGHLDVQVRRAPGVPAGRRDELAAGPVGGDLVGRRLDGVDLEPALLVAGERPAQVPLGDVGGELGVEAVGVGVPQLDLGPGQRAAVGGGHLAGPVQRGARLVVAHRDGAAGAL